MEREIGPATEYGLHTALLISPEEEDQETLQALFQRHGWTLRAVRSVDSATTMLRAENAPSIVITERDLVFETWRDVLRVIHGLPKPPLLIIISRLADERLWSEALNLGVHDVVGKPLDKTELVRVLTSAWLQQLTREMEATRKTYQEAAAARERIRSQYSDMLDHPDTTSAVHRAAKNEALACQKYNKAVQAYG